MRLKLNDTWSEEWTVSATWAVELQPADHELSWAARRAVVDGCSLADRVFCGIIDDIRVWRAYDPPVGYNTSDGLVDSETLAQYWALDEGGDNLETYGITPSGRVTTKLAPTPTDTQSAPKWVASPVVAALDGQLVVAGVTGGSTTNSRLAINLAGYSATGIVKPVLVSAASIINSILVILTNHVL